MRIELRYKTPVEPTEPQHAAALFNASTTSLALPKFESSAPLEKLAVCGLKTEARIEWFHGIGRLDRAQPSWDSATKLQAELFTAATRTGTLAVQLVYFRGLSECRASAWTALGRVAKSVSS
jgi:hypothetical protein